MLDIDSLTSRASDLTTKVDFWNGASIWALAFAALAAVAIVATQRFLVIRTKQLSEIQGQIATDKEQAANERILNLQKDAADAKAAQQRVELDLDKQREATAKAERSLLELQRRMAPRRLAPEQKKTLSLLLNKGPKGIVEIVCSNSNSESTDFANDIRDVLIATGFQVGGIGRLFSGDGSAPGVRIGVQKAPAAPPHALALQQAFFSTGIPLHGFESIILGPGDVQIVVGDKPS